MSPAVALHALAATLTHFGWQGALVALLLALALRALRRAPPEARYAASGAALAAMAAAPVVTFVLVGRALAAASPALASAAPHVPRPPTAADAATVAVAAAWGAGVLVMLVRLAGGALRVRAMVGRGTALPAAWQTLAQQLAARLGVQRPVRVLGSLDVEVPIALGWLRPAVLLPAALALDLPTPAVEALLAHELAHVRRHDWVLNVIQSAVEALLFYHPAVWWVSARVRAEREHCCDDVVVALTGDALGYARALFALESTRTEAAALGVAATGGSLMDRIERIVARTAAPHAPRVGLGHTLAVAAALLAGATAPLASCAAPADPAAASKAQAALPLTVTRWTPSFVVAGQRHGVDPDLLAVVTLVESRGDPEAVSPMGALGLMQVMPATAQRIAAERSLAGFSAEQLRDPEVNLDFGAFYLAAQLREFGAGQDPDRAIELAAAAYNGGEGAVRAYLAEGKPLSDETTHYKDRVVSLWRQRRAEAP